MNERPANGRRILPVPRGKVARAFLLAALLLSLALAVVVSKTAWIHLVERGYGRKQKLEQIVVAFKMYANESRGEVYPPMARGNMAFRPDLSTLDAYSTSDDQDLLNYLAGETGVDVCYLGHLLVEDSVAQALLDEYVDKGVERLRASDVEVDHAFYHGRTGRPTRTIWRMREGGERMVYYLFCDPAGRETARAQVPVLWELPDEEDPRTRHGGWVLYLNGDVKWQPYPGEFPMTEGLVRRLREMMETPVANWKKAWPPLAQEFPEAGRIREAVRPLEATRFLFGDPVRLSWAIAHLDRLPTMDVDGFKAHRIVLWNESWKWNAVSPTRLDPQALIELAVFPASKDLPAGLEQRIPWRSQQENDQAVAVDLGRGAGYRWFGRAASPWLGFVQERLALTGGSDYLDELIAWLTTDKDFNTRRLALGALSRYGTAALSFLEQEIDHPRILAGEERFRAEELTRTLELMPDARAGELLATLYHTGDEEMSARAGWALVDRPRPEGRAVYVDLLRRRKHTEGYFDKLARAAAQFGGPEARPLLRELCAHPTEYVASQARLVLGVWPIPEGLVGILGKPGEARSVHETEDRGGAPRFTHHRQGDLGAGACLDLDTGRIFKVPISVSIAEDPAVTRNWMRENGIDAVLEPGPERRTLALSLLDLRAFSTADQGPEPSAGDVLASLQRTQTPPAEIREEVEHPIVRLFATYEGASGVLRGELYERNTGSKGGPVPSFRFSYGLVDYGSAGRPALTTDAPSNTDNETPTPQNLIGATRQAILAYARAHQKRWPDSLEDVLAEGYLTVPDQGTFLAQVEYIKPWISLEELEGWGLFAPAPDLSDYKTVIAVRRKQVPAID